MATSKPRVTRHVLVVGGGIAGLASAWELARAGARVTLIERREIGRESSWAGAGILSALLPWDYRRPVNRLINASLARFPAWIEALRQASTTDPEYRRTGMLVLPPFDAAAADAWLNEHALGTEGLPPAVADALPDALAGLWLGHVAQVRNPRILRALREACVGAGVDIQEMREATGLRSLGERVTGVVTEAGLWRADDYVLTTGAWSAQLLGTLSTSLPVRPVRGQMLLYAATPERLPCIVYRDGAYLVPRADGLILAGSTLEDTGFDKSTTEQAYADIRAFAEALLPDLAGSEPVRHWAGLRPGSPDNIPVIARHPVLTNLYLNAGHFRYGVTMAPASAALLADLMLGRRPEIDPAPYSWPD
jgi:glycine oxidase